jgi:hypothetical protein
MPRLPIGWSRDAMLRAALSAVAASVLVIACTAPAQDRPGQPVLRSALGQLPDLRELAGYT